MKGIFITLLLLLSWYCAGAKSSGTIVADALTGAPVTHASIFNSKEIVVGTTNSRGAIPYISKSDFPITVRFLGYEELTLDSLNVDTVFMTEQKTQLHEVLVETRSQRMIHMLAYVREYSSLSSYTDTVFLFREKLVDFMVPTDNTVKYRGWKNPRVLKSDSYYRFTNTDGLDSVSNRCQYHFSWSDWLGVLPDLKIPSSLKDKTVANDTTMGKYSPVEIWTKNDDRISVAINVLADSACRAKVPNLSLFFKEQLDFENFRVQYHYSDVINNKLSVSNLTSYSIQIESNGRGHEMFFFNKKDVPIFVSTFAEVTILDKEYLTIKDAKWWEKRKFDMNEVQIIVPYNAAPLQSSVIELIARVNSIDQDGRRLNVPPDVRLIGRPAKVQNFADRAFTLFKELVGISSYKFRKNFNRNWDDMKRKR